MQAVVLFGLVCILAVVESTDAGANTVIYSQRLRDMAKHINSLDDVTWVAYDPEMSDDEFEQRRMVVESNIAKLQASSPSKRNHLFEQLDVSHPGFTEQILSAVDYSTHPKLRAVEDQGQCGSCWAFSTVHAFNDYINIYNANNPLVQPLSIQEVLTCCSGEGCGGCNGGYLMASYNYMARYGTPYAQCKRYNQYPGRCASSCDNGGSPAPHFYPTNYHPFSGSGMTSVLTALQTAPASGSLMVYEDLMTYRSGIYTHQRGGLQGGHAIEIVGYGGYGTSSSYWIVKNSWGPRWGASGFFKIRMGSNECNFESMERGYNTGTGFRSQVSNPAQPKFTSLDDPTAYPGDSAGDEVDDASTDDYLVLEAAEFAAMNLNPVYCDGNVTLSRVISAESQVVSGMKFFLTIAVNANTCTRGAEVFFVQVYMAADGSYEMQNSYGQGPLTQYAGEGCDMSMSASSNVDPMWKTMASVFIGLTAAALVLVMVLAYRLMHAPTTMPVENSTGNYHKLGADHDL